MRKICNYSAIMIAILGMAVAQTQGQVLINLSETTIDFGNVELGATGSDIVTITNVADEDIIVSASITFGAEFTTDWFGFVFISEGSTAEIDVNVYFDPVANCDATGELRIEVLVDDGTGTGDPIIGEEVFVDLIGTGGPTSCGDLIDEILISFDQSIADGTLVSTGNNPNRRYRALRNRIRAIGFLIDQGYFDQASYITGTAIERTDGAPNPKDFVAGSGLQELNDQLVLLKMLLDA